MNEIPKATDSGLGLFLNVGKEPETGGRDAEDDDEGEYVCDHS